MADPARPEGGEFADSPSGMQNGWNPTEKRAGSASMSALPPQGLAKAKQLGSYIQNIILQIFSPHKEVQ